MSRKFENVKIYEWYSHRIGLNKPCQHLADLDREQDFLNLLQLYSFDSPSDNAGAEEPRDLH